MLKAIIGANFGDEGKGLMTDYFASKADNGIVIRFNGGAQSGHTVVTPDGKRHVFGHFGSGTLAGLPTYLSSFFVVNPILFIKELAELRKLGVEPTIYVDVNCLVSTPYDMVINQIVEIDRGKNKHGSCGVGFNETIERCQSKEFKISVQDLLNSHNELRNKIKEIKEIYTPHRLKKLGINNIGLEFCEVLNRSSIIDAFMKDVEYFLSSIEVASVFSLDKYDSFIFEGGQGLLLDQSHKYFPHVTRSNTGIKNVVNILSEIRSAKFPLEIVYVTRSYMTRHGAGPFPTETEDKPYPNIYDPTNIPNRFQGALRYGLLDLDILKKSIKDDLKNKGLLENYIVGLAITCVDQTDEEIVYVENGAVRRFPKEEFVKAIFTVVDADPEARYISYGPTRNDVKKL